MGIYRTPPGGTKAIHEVKTMPRGANLADMLTPAYKNKDELSADQQKGKFLLVVEARYLHVRDASKGSEKPTHLFMNPPQLEGLLKGMSAHGSDHYTFSQIIVMNEIRPFNMVQNELETAPSYKAFDRARKKEGDSRSIQDFSVAADEMRQQRNYTILFDTRYIVSLQIVEQWTDPKKKFESFDLLKRAGIFKKRLVGGKQFGHLYAGIKECGASVRLCTIEDLMEESFYVGTEYDLGLRPFGIDYRDTENPVCYQYHAIMKDGKVDFPDEKEVMGDAAYVI